MKLEPELFRRFRAMNARDRRRLIARLGMAEREPFDRAWPLWAHRGQRPPPDSLDGADDWRTWVLMAGRGFGKTLAGAKWITEAIATGEKLHIALVGATLDEARRVMVEGRSGLLEVASGWIRDWSPTLRRLKFRTGAEAVLFSGASPDQLRGPEHHLAWCDELAKWEKPRDTWDMLQFGLRLGPNPRALITTTPRPGPVLTGIIAEPATILTRGRTAKNPHNSPAWRESVHARYAGTTLGRQELDGELLPEAGALWSVELLERCRAPTSPLRGEVGLARGEPGEGETQHLFAQSRRGAERPCASPLSGEAGIIPGSGRVAASRGDGLGPSAPPRLRANQNSVVRLVIAVDPPSGGGTCGIVACAKDSNGIAHVLADHSVTGASPERWAKAVADAVRIWSSPSSPQWGEGRLAAGERGEGEGEAPHYPTPLVVAEQNQGGRMVETILRTADPKLRVKPVTATVSKAERAAPIAHLFEAGKVVLHGRFPELEAELLGIVHGRDYQGPGGSPDRADAMVWGLTDLMLTPERAPPRIRQV